MVSSLPTLHTSGPYICVARIGAWRYAVFSYQFSAFSYHERVSRITTYQHVSAPKRRFSSYQSSDTAHHPVSAWRYNPSPRCHACALIRHACALIRSDTSMIRAHRENGPHSMGNGTPHPGRSTYRWRRSVGALGGRIRLAPTVRVLSACLVVRGGRSVCHAGTFPTVEMA